MDSANGKSGHLLLEVLVALAILGMATVAAGFSLTSAVQIADRGARVASSLAATQRALENAEAAARVCARAQGVNSSECEHGPSGWTAATVPDGAHAVRPRLTPVTCQFDLVSRECRA